MSAQRLLIPAFLAAGLLAPLVAAPAPAAADVLVRRDGTQLEGDVKKSPDGSGYDVRAADGTVTRVPRSEVKGVELKTPVTPDDAQRRLASLRRSSDNVPDPKTAVARFKEFAAKYAGTPAAEESKTDLAMWQDRVERGMTKSGDRWVTPAELGAIQEESLAAAIHARRLLKQGRLKEAGPILDEALKDDPTNASAHYLRGLMLYKQEQLGPAKKSFESIAPLVPGHAPSLNNLAVIHWRQNNFAAALAAYDAAILAAPGEPVILNNVAEALNALPAEHRKIGATKKLVLDFNEQDEAVAETMAKQGRYRWGAQWVTGAELDKLQAKEREIKDKIDTLEEQFESAKDQLEQIDADMTDTERSLRRIEADSYRRDATGRPTRRPLPQVYYELRRDLAELERERTDQEAEMTRLRAEAKKVQQEMPVPRYTGVQRLSETEGTPLSPRPDPATDPNGGGGGGAAPPPAAIARSCHARVPPPPPRRPTTPPPRPNRAPAPPRRPRARRPRRRPGRARARARIPAPGAAPRVSGRARAGRWNSLYLTRRATNRRRDWPRGATGPRGGARLRRR